MAQHEKFSSLKESVLERIRRDIVMRELPPGAVIRDSELATRYGISTSPLREALVQLASERLVDMPPNRPKRVTALDAKTAEDFFAVYKLVALAGFAWGAPKIAPKHLDAMKNALAALKNAFPVADRYEIAGQARKFFLPVYEASENAELINMITRRLSWIDRLLVLTSKFANDAVLVRMQLILDGLVSGSIGEPIRIHFDLLHEVGDEIRNLYKT